MNIIMLGAPGAGKGTQAAVLCEHFGIPTISTGNMIREALKNGTEMGLKAKSFMDEGKLVPDEVVIGIVKERLSADDCKKGFILDGFPRTIPQAEALDNMGVEIQHVINIDISDEKIINRMSGRRVCENCGRPFHIVTLKPILSMFRPRRKASATIAAAPLFSARTTTPIPCLLVSKHITKRLSPSFLTMRSRVSLLL